MSIVTPAERSEIADMIERARRNIIPWGTVTPYMNKISNVLRLSDRPPQPKQRPQSQRTTFANGMTAALSIEEQPAGLFRHLSISVDGALPDQAAAIQLGIEFGINPPAKCWVEEYQRGEFCVNLIGFDKGPH